MAAGADETAPPERPREERYGVLALDRRHKDDGRALTLYSHDENTPASDEDPAVEPIAGAEVKPPEADDRA